MKGPPVLCQVARALTEPWHNTPVVIQVFHSSCADLSTLKAQTMPENADPMTPEEEEAFIAKMTKEIIEMEAELQERMKRPLIMDLVDLARDICGYISHRVSGPTHEKQA